MYYFLHHESNFSDLGTTTTENGEEYEVNEVIIVIEVLTTYLPLSLNHI